LITASVLAFAGQRRHDPLAVLARRQRRANLAKQANLVGHEPGLDDLAVGEAEDPGFVDVDLLAGRGDPQEVALVRAGKLEQKRDHVAVCNDLLDDVGTVRKGAAQIVAGRRKSLVAGIGRDVLHAGAETPIAGSHEGGLDLLLRLGFHRLLVTEHHGLVALALRRLRLGEARTAGKHQAGAGGAGEYSTTGQHGDPP
jgi:hypothetical protein